MSIGDRITQRLKELGLSRRAASEEARLNETFIRDLIDGRTASPRVASLEKLAKALQTNVEWLTKGTGDSDRVDDPQTAEVISIMPKLDDARRAQLAEYARYLAQQKKP